MSKELIAILALALTLAGTVYAAGVRIGTLTERVGAQTKEIELLRLDVRAINQHIIAWAGAHQEAPPARRPR